MTRSKFISFLTKSYQNKTTIDDLKIFLTESRYTLIVNKKINGNEQFKFYYFF